jgi:hypothetical protein
MKTSHRLAVVALPLGLALSAGAVAADSPAPSDTAAVETLKSKLPSTLGFHVDNMRSGTDGVSCITYRVDNGNGGAKHEQAVVQGDKVQRGTPGNTRFAKEWNSKCAKAG